MAKKKKPPKTRSRTSKPGTRSSDPGQPSNRSLPFSWQHALIAVVVVAAIARAAFLAEIADSPALSQPVIDAAYHDLWARGLAFGDWTPPEGMRDPEIREHAYFRPPGYPVFLSGIYWITRGNPLATRVVQSLLGLFNTVLAAWLARKLFGLRAAVFTAILAGLCWPLIFFEMELLAPTLTATALLGLVVAGLSWARHVCWKTGVIAGSVLAIGALIRPNTLLCAPLLMLWLIWIFRQTWKDGRLWISMLCFCFAAALVIAPVTIRNKLVSGDFIPITSNMGINLYIGNNPKSDGVSAVIPEIREWTGLEGWTCFDSAFIAQKVAEKHQLDPGPKAVSSFFTARALSTMTAHPGHTLAQWMRKLALMLGPVEVSNNKEIAHERAQSTVLSLLPGFSVALAAALCGILLLGYAPALAENVETRPSPFQGIVLIAGLSLAMVGSYVPFFAAGRFRTPLIPLLALLGGFGISQLITLVQRGLGGRQPLWIVGVLACIVLPQIPLVPYHPDAANHHFQQGVLLDTQGKLDQALIEYQAAVDLQPQWVGALEKLGNTQYQLGLEKEARDNWSRALEIQPQHGELSNNLAWLLATSSNRQVRDPARAVAWAERSCRLTSFSDAGKLDTLATAYAAAGSFDKALETLHMALDLARAAHDQAMIQHLEENQQRFQARHTP